MYQDAQKAFRRVQAEGLYPEEMTWEDLSEAQQQAFRAFALAVNAQKVFGACFDWNAGQQFGKANLVGGRVERRLHS